jgi:methyltransferase
MGVSKLLFLALLGLVAVLRLFEVRRSRRNQRTLAARGAALRADPAFKFMAAFHSSVLTGAAAEVVFLDRPLIPPAAAAATILFLCANAVRWWVIRTMREHWNVSVVDSTGIGIVTTGPFHWVRHPNYAAVFVEMAALPMIHTAWLTAAAGAVLHVFLLRARLRVEEAVLASDPRYRREMGGKPRFVPRLTG